MNYRDKDPRDVIIRDLIQAVIHRQAALKACQEVIEWHNKGAHEIAGTPISDWITNALNSGIRT